MRRVDWVSLNLLRQAILVIIFYSVYAVPAGSANLIADLSLYHLIKGKDFSSSEMVVSGVSDRNDNVLIIIRGPKQSYRVWQKQRKLGIWSNKQYKVFHDVASYFAMAYSGEREPMFTPSLSERLMISYPELLPFPKDKTLPSENLPFYKELVDTKRKNRFYSVGIDKIERVGEYIFRLKVHIPQQASVGSYEVDVYILNGDQVEQSLRLHFMVSNDPFDQNIREMAGRHPMQYAGLAIILALTVGSMAAFLFRKQ